MQADVERRPASDEQERACNAAEEQRMPRMLAGLRSLLVEHQELPAPAQQGMLLRAACRGRAA